MLRVAGFCKVEFEGIQIGNIDRILQRLESVIRAKEFQWRSVAKSSLFQEKKRDDGGASFPLSTDSQRP